MDNIEESILKQIDFDNLVSFYKFSKWEWLSGSVDNIPRKNELEDLFRIYIREVYNSDEKYYNITSGGITGYRNGDIIGCYSGMYGGYTETDDKEFCFEYKLNILDREPKFEPYISDIITPKICTAVNKISEYIEGGFDHEFKNTFLKYIGYKKGYFDFIMHGITENQELFNKQGWFVNNNLSVSLIDDILSVDFYIEKGEQTVQRP